MKTGGINSDFIDRSLRKKSPDFGWDHQPQKVKFVKKLVVWQELLLDWSWSLLQNRISQWMF